MPITLETMKERLDALVHRHADVERMLANPEVLQDLNQLRDLGREHRDLSTVVETYGAFQKVLAEIKDAESAQADSSDPELQAMAEEELTSLRSRQETLEQELRTLLVPKDPNDHRNVIMEIRAGTGGEEAALFAADLYRMYQRFAERRGWRAEDMAISPSEVGGYKEAIFNIAGEDVYGTLRFEGGVHRVQRVPVTEASGRIHTSAASVAVLPEAEAVEVELDPNDLDIDVYRSSGPGGQSVNTTDSAVRITHRPTGLVVTCQDEKSQHKNKAKAMKVLASRLLARKQEEAAARLAADRRAMVGSGDRSAKIRTYNYPQGRVSDHRINLTLYKLEAVLDGDLDELVEGLIIADRTEKLEQGLVHASE